MFNYAWFFPTQSGDLQFAHLLSGVLGGGGGEMANYALPVVVLWAAYAY